MTHTAEYIVWAWLAGWFCRGFLEMFLRIFPERK